MPGDREQISREAAHLSRVATTTTGQIAALRKIADSRGNFEFLATPADRLPAQLNGDEAVAV